LFLVVVKC